MELRIRNNYANAVTDDDPVRATNALAEAADIARDMGDRGMYYWLLGMTAVWQIDQGVRWDENLAELKEAYEVAPIRTDKLRLRIFIGLIEAARGQRLDEYLADITELSTGGASKDDEFALLMTRAHVAFRRGAHMDSYRSAMQAHDLQPQNPEIPLLQAMSAVMHAGDATAIRDVATRTDALTGSGAVTAIQKRTAAAARTAVDGHTGEAVAELRAIHDDLVYLEQRYAAATHAIHATALLPDQRQLRELAESGRPVLEELRAAADLADLDRVLASAPVTADGQVAPASAPRK